MSQDIYVVVAENDQHRCIKGRAFFDDGGPLVFEQYTKKATLTNAVERIDHLKNQYGQCRIAKLVFIDKPEKKHD